MCTILTYPETLPAEKRSMEDSQKAIDRLMAFDRQLSEPFTREELKQLFTPDARRGQTETSIFPDIPDTASVSPENEYEVLTDEEKAVVDELGLTPEQPLSAKARRRRMKAALIKSPNLATEEEVKELYERMKPELGDSPGFVGGLGIGVCSGFSGQIYVWLDNMNFTSARKGFYYVRYQRSMLWRGTTAYAYPVLVVEKSKLRPDQIEYMESKCRETLASGRKK